MNKIDSLSRLSVPVNSFLLSDNNKFIGVVQGKRFRSNGGDTPTPESIISALEDVKNSVSEVSTIVDSLVDGSVEINDEINELKTNMSEISSVTVDVENLSKQIDNINNSLEDIYTELSSKNLEEYFPLSGNVIISGDVAFNGNVVKNIQDIYSGIYLIEETDTFVTNMLSVNSVSFFAKNANGVDDIFENDLCEFVLKIKENEEDPLEEQEVETILYGEDVFGNKFVSVVFSKKINSIRIQNSIENNEIQIFAIVDGSEIILKTLQKNEINISYETTEESFNVATEKDVSELKEELSNAIDSKFTELNQVFIEKNEDIYIAPGKNIYQVYEDDLKQKYITAKDLDSYDAFANSRDEINDLSALENNTDNVVLSGIIDRLNQILTILKNN